MLTELSKYLNKIIKLIISLYSLFLGLGGLILNRCNLHNPVYFH